MTNPQDYSPDVLELNPEMADILRGKGKKRGKGNNGRSESLEQRFLFDWCKRVVNMIPELEILHAVPNGQYRPGQRLEPGTMSGIPDVCLPVPVNGYHGFYGELKVGNNTTSPSQDRCIEILRNNGYCVVVAYGWQAMAKAVLEYLGRDDELADW